jgi:hypothetical protein
MGIERGENMKIAIKIQIMLFGMFILIAPVPVRAVCNMPDYEHANKEVARCWYTQKDLTRIHQKDTERHKEMGIDGTVCFYCGCDLEEHTPE